MDNSRNQYGFKHQGKCYRTIKGVVHNNYADLIYGDEENARIVAEAKELYNSVRVIKRCAGEDWKAVFVADSKIKNMVETTMCPRCKGWANNELGEYPALSRRDNKTNICSPCGQEEAMFDYANQTMATGGGFVPVGLEVYSREKLFAKYLATNN